MKHSRGFTLTEALVSMAIIAILAAIVSISVREIRLRAEANALVVELGEIETALTAYRQFELVGGPLPDVSANNNLQGIIAGDDANFPNFEQYFGGDFRNLFNYDEVGYRVEPYADCGGDRGVQIRVHNNSGNQGRLLEMMPMIERAIDGEYDESQQSTAFNCGKARLIGSSNSLYYVVSESRFGY